MKRRTFLASALAACFGSRASFARDLKKDEFRSAPGAFRDASAHVQGICCDDDALYVVFENYVYKLDWNGDILRSTPAPSHSGDACLANGRLYVSMTTQDGSALYEYDSELTLLRKLKLERCPGCDGVEFFNGRFYIGGPSTAEPHRKNLVLIYDAEFNFVGQGDVDFGGATVYGPQSITSARDRLLFAFYPEKEDDPTTLRSAWTDANLRTLGASALDGANGWAVAPKRFQHTKEATRLVVARTERIDDETVLKLRFFDFDGGSLVEATENAR